MPGLGSGEIRRDRRLFDCRAGYNFLFRYIATYEALSYWGQKCKLSDKWVDGMWEIDDHEA